MDESLGECAIDISGRPFCRFDSEVPEVAIAGFDAELAEEFFRAVASNAKLTLHVGTRYGSNAHHLIEASFKAFARALREAVVDRPGRARRALHQGYAHLRDPDRDPRLWDGQPALGEKALERVGAQAERITDVAAADGADGLVLPGVGAFPEAMRRLAFELASTAWPATGRRPGGRCSGICLGHAAPVRAPRPRTAGPRAWACSRAR